MLCYDLISGTFVGEVLIAATTKGLCAVSIGRKVAAFRADLVRMFPGERLKKDPARLRPYRKQLEEYFRGERTSFDAPIDLSGVRRSFQRKVLRKLRAFPFGRVLTYGELAARCGSPGAARAVGGALAANPLAIVIPCHRVVAASGGLGGLSGGLWRKRRLLGHEGVGPRVRPRRSGR